jgi:hypothetical protein
MSAETIWAGLRICYRVVGWSLFYLQDGGAAFPWSIRGVQDCFQQRQGGWSSWSSVFICIWGVRDQDEVCTVHIPGCKAARLALRHSEL